MRLACSAPVTLLESHNRFLLADLPRLQASACAPRRMPLAAPAGAAERAGPERLVLASIERVKGVLVMHSTRATHSFHALFFLSFSQRACQVQILLKTSTHPSRNVRRLRKRRGRLRIDSEFPGPAERGPMEEMAGATHMSQNQTDRYKNGEPRTMLQKLGRQISAAIYGDCPFLTFIYPGFDCGSYAGCVPPKMRFETETAFATTCCVFWNGARREAAFHSPNVMRDML